jgi:hypothetical protein
MSTSEKPGPGSPQLRPSKFWVTIDGRPHPQLVTAVDEQAAVERVYKKWGVDPSSHVVATFKSGPSKGPQTESSVSDQSPPASKADGLAVKLGRTLARWHTAELQQRAGIDRVSRTNLEEEGCASGQVKTAAFHALERHGVPMASLLQIATEFLEAKAREKDVKEVGPEVRE